MHHITLQNLGAVPLSVDYYDTQEPQSLLTQAATDIVALDPESTEVGLQITPLRETFSYRTGMYQIPYGLSKTFIAKMCLTPDDSLYSDIISLCFDMSDNIKWSLDSRDEDKDKFELGELIKGRVKVVNRPSIAMTEALDNIVNLNARLVLDESHVFDAEPLKIKAIAPEIQRLEIRAGEVQSESDAHSLTLFNYTVFTPEVVVVFKHEPGVETSDIPQFTLNNDDAIWIQGCAAAGTGCEDVYQATETQGVFETTEFGQEYLTAILKTYPKIKTVTQVNVVTGNIIDLEVQVHYDEQQNIADNTFDISEVGTFTVMGITDEGERIDVTDEVTLSGETPVQIRASHFSPQTDRISTHATLKTANISASSIIIPEDKRTQQWAFGDGLLHVEPTVCLEDLCKTFEVNFTQKPLEFKHEGLTYLMSAPLQYGFLVYVTGEYAEYPDYKWATDVFDGVRVSHGQSMANFSYGEEFEEQVYNNNSSADLMLFFMPDGVFQNDNYNIGITKGWDKTCAKIFGDGWVHVSNKDFMQSFNQTYSRQNLNTHGWPQWDVKGKNPNEILSRYHHDHWFDGDGTRTLGMVDSNKEERKNDQVEGAPIMCFKVL